LAAGHQQLVATARALVRRIGLLLMDEPLAHLDARAREAARVELKRLQQELGTTVLYVTNDQKEAMALGRRVAVLAGGRLQQVAPPRQLYGRPANTVVAGFIGERPMNLLPGELHPVGTGAEVVVGDDRLRVGGSALAASPYWRDWLDMPVTVGVRPEHLGRARPGHPFPRCLHGRVDLVEDHGAERFARIDLGFPGGVVWARLGADDRACPGDRLELAAAVESIMFFDPVGGSAI
jgi:multiple sugar transport system ATP-binding protein